MQTAQNSKRTFCKSKSIENAFCTCYTVLVTEGQEKFRRNANEGFKR